MTPRQCSYPTSPWVSRIAATWAQPLATALASTGSSGYWVRWAVRSLLANCAGSAMVGLLLATTGLASPFLRLTEPTGRRMEAKSAVRVGSAMTPQWCRVAFKPLAILTQLVWEMSLVSGQ